MRILASLFISLTFAVLSFAAATSGAATSKPPKAKICNPKAKGPRLAELQEEAIREFSHLWLVKFDIQSAWDNWVPGTYVQHHPDAQGGREYAIEFLKKNFAAPGNSVSNITVLSGNGYGVLHYKWTSPAITYAIMDRLRFEGTCIVEHWDVIQQITGKETNPIAFF